MTILRQIAQLGQPVLREPARAIVNPADPTVQALIDDMLATVADADGVGIAAPQIYESFSLFIVASRPNPRYPHAPAMTPTAMINPEIVWASAETETAWEGCLSVPGLRGLVSRHQRIGVRYLTRTGERIPVSWSPRRNTCGSFREEVGRRLSGTSLHMRMRQRGTKHRGQNKT